MTYYVDHITSRRCPMCQDYLASVMRDVDHAALARAGVRLIVIGCGSYGLIRSYRRAHPFHHLTDGIDLTTISHRNLSSPLRTFRRRVGRADTLPCSRHGSHPVWNTESALLDGAWSRIVRATWRSERVSDGRCSRATRWDARVGAGRRRFAAWR
jgi:hypothetical protein